MKINSNNINPNLASGLGNSDRVTKSKTGDGDANASKVSSALLDSSAKVNISEKAKEINRVKELAKQAPDVDAEKVAKFRSLIANGEYKINAGAIADKMVDEELMMSSIQGS
ncbi:MAG: flagellar biosynthesis anti-sigma factor FlgM [Bdellovibrionales bacterium]